MKHSAFTLPFLASQRTKPTTKTLPIDHTTGAAENVKIQKQSYD